MFRIALMHRCNAQFFKNTDLIQRNIIHSDVHVFEILRNVHHFKAINSELIYYHIYLMFPRLHVVYKHFT